MSVDAPSPSLPTRTRVANAVGQAVSALSRRIGTGQGSTIGGRFTLAIDPGALSRLAEGRRVALVSGTNGKTTTTRLLAAGLAVDGSVASNSAGANLLPGLAGTLSSEPSATYAALEVDEGLLPKAMRALRPGAVLLLNLSRDQLDRIGEVRLHAQSWRRALAASPETVAVANADDPLVTWAAGSAGRVTWVGTGQQWRADATACPACGSRIRWAEPVGGASGGTEPRAAPGNGSVQVGAGAGGWACSSCDLARPADDLAAAGDELVFADGRRLPIRILLPGWCNRANAAMAVGGAMALGVDPAAAIAAMSDVGTVAGRYQVVSVDDVQVRLVLAKNPAGWAEALELLRPPPLPVVIGINARIADGRDPSWLWDVPFEKLQGRLVVATGDRGRDLAVRLRYAGVEHTFVDGYREAVRAAASPDLDLAANYTSFQDARKELAVGS